MRRVRGESTELEMVQSHIRGSSSNDLLCALVIQLVGNVQLTQLARRPEDRSYVLRNIASEQYGGKHVYKLNANSDKDAIYLRRHLADGKDSLEKVWRKRCPRCELIGSCIALDSKM